MVTIPTRLIAVTRVTRINLHATTASAFRHLGLATARQIATTDRTKIPLAKNANVKPPNSNATTLADAFRQLGSAMGIMVSRVISHWRNRCLFLKRNFIVK